jgi:ABC-type branched-subunit amino acid transport system ATPase component
VLVSCVFYEHLYPFAFCNESSPRLNQLLIGKTSLLNALCGRAYYGQVAGEVHLNGQPTAIEEIKDSVGFVPQVSSLKILELLWVLHPVLTQFFECGSKDDIVYAELTVRENLIYSGKFRLPKGTPANVIGDYLADEALD